MKTRTTALFLMAALAAAPLPALEIPLGGSGGEGAAIGGAKVGYVDMDRIFQIYPQTQVAKEDYTKQLQKKRDQLSEKESQVMNLKTRVAVIESTMKSATGPDATAPEAAQGGNLDEMKKQLETQMTEYEEMRKQAERDLAVFQGQQSQIILGKIYTALRDLALEEQVTLVVDKASILYGDATVDLTEKLQTKVRGY